MILRLASYSLYVLLFISILLITEQIIVEVYKVLRHKGREDGFLYDWIFVEQSRLAVFAKIGSILIENRQTRTNSGGSHFSARSSKSRLDCQSKTTKLHL